MIKKFLFIFLLVTSGVSCKKTHTANNLSYYQDFESIKGWFSLSSLSTNIPAHSGTYSLLNSPMEYSYGFASLMADISKKPLKNIKASVWCYSESKLCSGLFCIQIVNPASENKFWLAKSFSDVIKSENKWTKIVLVANLPNEALNPNNTVKVFLWNKGNVPVYGDDFAIEFLE